MKHKNTRKELLVSVLALLLCVSMLVGSTFAWFTDNASSGMNTIAAGNLDIELLADGVKVTENTQLFDDVDLWEPGVVVYENLQVSNVGTLALKYQLSLNFGNENNLNGHKLSEVLKVAIIDKIDASATRAEVLEAAKAASPKALNLFNVAGELLPGAVAAEQTVVIFWEPNADEIDNLYNANNDQDTSDGQPLHIEFGVKLEATQLMYEEDSFGNDYDEFATILPHASVNAGPAKTVNARMYDGSTLGPSESIDLDFTMQFLPNESYQQAQASAYRFYHADFVVKADKDVAANSMILAGFYNAWCELIDYDWVYLASPDDIPANTEVRLVNNIGAFVNYEEICKYGNDGTGFLCGAADRGGNEGTTITVELRLYETTGDPSTPDGPKNIETGEFITVGTYTYTF